MQTCDGCQYWRGYRAQTLKRSFRKSQLGIGEVIAFGPEIDAYHCRRYPKPIRTDGQGCGEWKAKEAIDGDD